VKTRTGRWAVDRSIEKSKHYGNLGKCHFSLFFTCGAFLNMAPGIDGKIHPPRAAVHDVAFGHCYA